MFEVLDIIFWSVLAVTSLVLLGLAMLDIRSIFKRVANISRMRKALRGKGRSDD